MSGEQKNVSCKNINWQWFPRLAHAWDVLWCDIVSVDQIAHGKCDCRTVILAIIFYRSLVSESSVTGLGVYTRRWVYDNITPHSLCYLARVRPVICPIIKCLTVLEFYFILFDLCLFITIFNFILNYVPTVTFWIFTYHKIWILLIIFCFIWNYWIIYFLTCLEVFWSVVS